MAACRHDNAKVASRNTCRGQFILYRASSARLSVLEAMSADPSPVPAMMRLLKSFAESVRADGVTLWKAEAGHLRAIANPLEPELPGTLQPLGAGLISQVYLTGQSILEDDLPSHPAHDPGVDRRTGKTCHTMMAAAVEGGDASGVVSAVIFNGSTRGFAFADLAKLNALARNLGNLLKEGGW
jgi:hypothetical protein